MRQEVAPSWVFTAIVMLAITASGLMIRGGIDVVVWACGLVRAL